ncbi:hypothetical protein MSAN_01164300 [Mycena sanguinolenta]|uniref:Uncharacterized protein n=1 Tax=Mycena sanguinolenta TaxID=230812 RepID=A0A8H7D753_9AGAR|nr:hypothetical protein MSAN_01164300 [Mycena sanguinolenta]
MPTWFQRAGHHPLSISLRGDFRKVATHRIPTIVWRHGEQLKELEILHEEDDSEFSGEETDEDGLPDVLDVFGDAAPQQLPMLETLMVRNEVEDRGFLAPQIIQLLFLAPNLMNYMFSGSFLFASSISSEMPIFPTLRTLTFGSRDKPQLDAGILSRGLFPALAELSVAMDISGRNIFDFVKQSTPALQSLLLGMLAYDTPDSDELHECLHLISSLERLEMWYPRSHHLDHFFVSLANSPSLLPNLCTLIIHPYVVSNSREPLLRVLSTRRIKLHIDGKYVKKPPQDALAAMAELVTCGAEIYIRSDTFDYI